MRSVLRSVKPYWIYCILEGLKNIEVGKDFPKADDWDRTVFLYCSKDRKSLNRIPVEYRAKYERLMGKVVCEFTCEKITDHFLTGCSMQKVIEETLKGTCLTLLQYYDYEDSRRVRKCTDRMYHWHISDLVIYDKPKELGEFFAKGDCNNKNCKSCRYFDGGNGYNVEADCLLPYEKIGDVHPLERPPQSWFYVEVV